MGSNKDWFQIPDQKDDGDWKDYNKLHMLNKDFTMIRLSLDVPRSKYLIVREMIMLY